jgi:hypothetical protein
MFNLIVSGHAWPKAGRHRFNAGRIFEYTDDSLKERFSKNSKIDFESLVDYPAIFLQETYGSGNDQIAYVGSITRVTPVGKDFDLDYSWDRSIPPLPNSVVEELAAELGIQSFEFSRVHWAVKDVDLFQTLLRHAAKGQVVKRVFNVDVPSRIDQKLASAMMPFASSFNGVYDALKQVCQEYGLVCKRADDIWEDSTVINDVVRLIDRAKIVICDCSGRNANVFYEIGIAHALGREVILITQSSSDIPFDLQHLRYVQYLNNSEGLLQLQAKLRKKLEAITGQSFDS